MTEEILQRLHEDEKKRFNEKKAEIKTEKTPQKALEGCKVEASEILKAKLSLHEKVSKWSRVRDLLLEEYITEYQAGMRRINHVDSIIKKVELCKEIQLKQERKSMEIREIAKDSNKWEVQIYDKYSGEGFEIVKELKNQFDKLEELKESLKQKIGEVGRCKSRKF